MLKLKKKTALITKHQMHEKDTGSPEVQISLLTERIDELSGHLKTHKKDLSSKRGLLRMIIRRKRLTNWLRTSSPKRFQKISKALKLEK